MLYEIRNGSVSLGGQSILRKMHFYIKGDEKMALVGRNGAGKTTLLRLIAGQIDLDIDEKSPDTGIYRSRDFSIGYLGQEIEADPMESAYQAMLSSDPADGPNALRLFTQLGFAREEAARPLAQFSGGQQKKIFLISMLLQKPELLMLDEPTNHLDLEAVAWLEEKLISYPGTVLLVSHDRYFLDRVAQVTWELEAGKTLVYPGNYSAYRKLKEVRSGRQRRAYEAQQEEIARLNTLIEKFRHKPKKAAFARSRKKMLERMERVEKPGDQAACMHPKPLLPVRRGNKWVYQAENLRIGYETVLHQVNLKVRRGARIGLIGSNGSGKSTFLKTLAGKIPALSGRGTLGSAVDLAYFDQFSARISGSIHLGDYFRSCYPDLTDRQVRQILSGYLFVGSDLDKPIDGLSGGEKARLVLATLLTAGPNLLVLDEPTNHMDIPSMEAVEEILRAYQGTIILASHDRYFLRQVTDSLLVFRDEVFYYPFDFDHYMEHRAELEEGADPAALRTAEEQKMVEDLRAIPGKSYLPRPLSFNRMEREWEYARAKDAVAEAEEKLCRLTEDNAVSGQMSGRNAGKKGDTDHLADDVRRPDAAEIPSLEEYMSGAWDKRQEASAREIEEAEEELTRDLTDWYDLWVQDHPEERG